MSSLVTTASPTVSLAPLDKERTIYSLGGPTPTLASSNNFHFIDNRSADPNLVGVRQLEFAEILERSGFASDLSDSSSVARCECGSRLHPESSNTS